MRIHPGETLKEMMEDRQVTCCDIATKTKLVCPDINWVVRGANSISIFIAEELGKFFKTGEHFWLNLQKNYDEEGSDGHS